MVFHVLNRANARARIYRKNEHYAAFERVMAETFARKPMRILGSSLWKHDLAGNACRETRTRIHLSSTWKTKETLIIGLIPFKQGEEETRPGIEPPPTRQAKKNCNKVEFPLLFLLTPEP